MLNKSAITQLNKSALVSSSQIYTTKRTLSVAGLQREVCSSKRFNSINWTRKCEKSKTSNTSNTYSLLQGDKNKEHNAILKEINKIYSS